MIPRGTVVLSYQNYWMHNKMYWENPEEFNPDRFMYNGKFNNINKAFTPFGIGTRRCVGEHYAIVALFILFSRLIQKSQDISVKILNQNHLIPDRNKFTESYPEKYEILFERDHVC